MQREALRKRSVRGFSIVELLAVIALLTMAMLVVGALSHQLHWRYRVISAVREVHATVLATRMQAVKRNRNVILFVDMANHRLESWADNLPYNFRRDTNEPIINQFVVPPIVVFRSAPSGQINGPDAVTFDEYNGDKSLVDRIVFRPDGTIAEPQGINGNPPQRPGSYTAEIPFGSIECRDTNIPSTGGGPVGGEENGNNGVRCRGIFLADQERGGPSRNVFRISVDDFGRSGRVSILKWLPQGPQQAQGGGGWDFVPPNPAWKWFGRGA